MIKSLVDYNPTGIFSQLILDYVEEKDYLKSLYSLPFAKESFLNAIEDRKKTQVNREVLTKVLKEQYRNLESSPKVTDNIESLLNPNTYTVTTGHQLCIFTGPLFFIYKLISTIITADQLNQAYPEYHFVPVYWMASEDHDFEEINHIHLFNKTFVWNEEQRGPAGRLPSSSLKSLIEELKTTLGTTEEAIQLISLFEKAYLEHSTLAEATRYIVNALFREYGLVVLDPDNKQLKQEFLPYMKEDILQQSNYTKVKETIAFLEEKGFKAQVNPRFINIFYLNENSRNRIEQDGNQFKVLNTSVSFTEEELETELESFPERFSPNVVLRPMYQEAVLPNLAYIGGPGELAYWLEYKAMFEKNKLPFPLLGLRCSALIVDKATKEKLGKLEFAPSELFEDIEELIKTLINRSSAETFSMDKFEKELSSTFNTIKEKAIKSDPTLKGSVEAELQKALNGLKTIESKIIRSEKQKQEIQINQLRKIKDKLFPKGIPQERHDNFMSFYINNREDFFGELFNHMDPFEKKFLLLLNES